MNPLKKRFKRPLGNRRYKTLFIIAAEGAKTEREHFDLLNQNHAMIKIEYLKNNDKSAPKQVLAKMNKRLAEEKLKNTDEAWIVIDRDGWDANDIDLLFEWSKGKNNYGFCLSNPKFEYWLLLHFEEGIGIASTNDCSERLKRYLPSYNKGIDKRKINRQNINKAIGRAAAKDRNRTSDWPTITGTTVYILVQHILQADS
jgi:hypothetical protein